MSSKNPFKQSIISERIILGINLVFTATLIVALLNRDGNSGDKEIILDIAAVILTLYMLGLTRLFYSSNVLLKKRAALGFKWFSLIPGIYLLPAMVTLLEEIASLGAIQLFFVISVITWLFASINHVMLPNTHAIKQKK